MKKLRERSNIEICKDNGMVVMIPSNTVDEKIATAKFKSALSIVAKILCATLGPYGTTTIIQNQDPTKHFATKDGYDLMNRIKFQDDVFNTILDMTKNVASNQVLSVGDGSTSAIIVAEALYSALTDDAIKAEYELSRIASKDIVDILSGLSDYIEEELPKKSIGVSDDLHELEKIAAISTNNDEKAGKFMLNLYKTVGKNGFISTDVLHKLDEDWFELKKGIEWDRGYINSCYGQFSKDNKKVVYEEDSKNPEGNVKVFISKDFLTFDDIDNILTPILKETVISKQYKLLIIANGYDDDLQYFLRQNRIKHLTRRNDIEYDYTAVDIDTVTKTSQNNIEDLGILCDCLVYDRVSYDLDFFKENYKSFIGSASKIIVSEKTTQIIGRDIETERLKNHINSLNKALEERLEEPGVDETDFDVYEYKRRLNSFSNSVAILHVGGKTLTEKMTRERLFEDAIFACKSAIKTGYIIGGNIMIPRLLQEKKEEITNILSERFFYVPVKNVKVFFTNFINLLTKIFETSYRHVLENSYMTPEEIDEVIDHCIKNKEFYNLKLHKYEKDSETSVINSTKTDIEIMKSCFSIIGILATSNQIITTSFNTTDLIEKISNENN